MRSKVIILTIIIIVLILLYIIIFKKKEETINIKKFYYSYTNGYAINAYTTYELICEDKCTLIIKPYGIAEEDKIKITVDKKIKKNLEEIINKYNIIKWNGFNKTNKNVLDGDSFNLSIMKEDGKNISASGYMSWPKNYREFSKEVDNLFNKYIKEVKND